MKMCIFLTSELKKFKDIINFGLPLPRGFEPLTPRLTVVCSNQLSYRRWCIEWGSNPRSLRYQILSLAP